MLALHIAFSLAILALMASLAITIKASNVFAKLIAIIALALSLLNVGCISYYGYRYWSVSQNTMPYPNMMHAYKPMPAVPVNK